MYLLSRSRRTEWETDVRGDRRKFGGIGEESSQVMNISLRSQHSLRQHEPDKL